MSRSRSTFLLLVVLLAGLGWQLWRLASGGRPGVERAEAGAAAAAVEELASRPMAPPRTEVQLASGTAERVAVEEGEADPSPATPGSAPEAGEATLALQVLASESGSPLGGIEMFLRERSHWPGSVSTSTASRGGLGGLRTDGEGRVEYTVPAGLELELQANAFEKASVERVRVDVTALAGGERRALEVRLGTEPDFVWFGRIVDGETDEGLAGAFVRRQMNPFAPHAVEVSAQSAADGSVRLLFTSWRRSYARVELDGYAPAFVFVDPGHEEPATACTVRLLRAASLEVLVTDPAGTHLPVDVRVVGEARDLMQGGRHTNFGVPTPAFEARTGLDGRCVLEGLPPRVSLEAELSRGGELLRREESALRLEPGERRAVSWIVGSGCTLAGRTLESDGRAAAGVTVWLLPDDGDALLRSHRVDQVAARAVSDAQGRFTLEVAAGAWLVGTAPVRSSSGEGRAEIAATATRLEVAPEQTSAEVTLTCWRGLFLRGTVRGPDGNPVASGSVSAFGEGGLGGDGDELRDGRFSIGPLPPGSYRVSAQSFGEDDLASSEPRTVAAGTEDIELVLRRGASLTVRVLDARGDPVADAMTWFIDSAGGAQAKRSGADGEVRFERLVPGLCTISASTGGEFALTRVTLAAGDEPAIVELRLEPASRLRVEVLPRPEPRHGVAVLLDGSLVSFVLPEDDPTTVLAPGEYELVLQRFVASAPEVLQRRRVRVEADSEARVVFDLSAPR